MFVPSCMQYSIWFSVCLLWSFPGWVTWGACCFLFVCLLLYIIFNYIILFCFIHPGKSVWGYPLVLPNFLSVLLSLLFHSFICQQFIRPRFIYLQASLMGCMVVLLLKTLDTEHVLSRLLSVLAIMNFKWVCPVNEA